MIMKLSVVIVVFNEYKIIQKCIASVYANKYSNIEIILVHNYSGISGIKEVLLRFPKVIYIENKNNLGFGGAVNVGIKKSSGGYILVLTPDTFILPNTITKTIECIEQNKNIGLVGCKVYSYPRTFNRSAFSAYPNLLTHLFEYNVIFYKILHVFKKNYIPTMYSLGSHKKRIIAKHITGAYMLFRKSAIKSIGMFDNNYFLYREETDVCKRLNEMQWQVVYLPVDGVVHSGEGAVHQKITQASPNYLKSTYYFFKKHYGIDNFLLAYLLGLTSSFISIFFLFFVLLIRLVQNKESQSRYLLSCWLQIFLWHCGPGLKLFIDKK